MSLRRYFQQPSCVFAWPLTGHPLQEARDRHAVTGNPTQGRGPYNNHVGLDGANDYITLGSCWEIPLRFDSGSQDFSVVAWVRRAVTGADHAIISKMDAWGDGWHFRFSATDRLQFFVNGAVDFSDVTITDTNWHNVAGVVDRSASIQVYLDGVAASAPTVIAGPAMATTIVPRIGASSWNAGQKFQGDIAGIVIINRILSPEEAWDISHGTAF